MLADAELQAVSIRLTRAAGYGRPVTLDRLAGGKNNRVYRVILDDGGPLVLKSYHVDARDRLGSEWNFLTYAWKRQIRGVPEPLACERETDAGLYSFLPGRTLHAGEVTARHVAAAADFVCAVNAPPRELGGLAAGSEACFTLAMHVAAVARRVARLTQLDPDAPGRQAAESFVRARLEPAWAAVESRVERERRSLGLAWDDPIDVDETCLSPSDFGFHNALVSGDAIGFIDFEYAGRDDPAKLVCDFFCQPDVPVPIAHYDGFLERLISGLGLNEAARARCALLLDAYRVKWVCIILNDFLPTDAARRDFAEAGRRAERCEIQLAKADRQIEQVRAA